MAAKLAMSTFVVDKQQVPIVGKILKRKTFITCRDRLAKLLIVLFRELYTFCYSEILITYINCYTRVEFELLFLLTFDGSTLK